MSVLTCREVWTEWKEIREGMVRGSGGREGDGGRGGEEGLRVASKGHHL